MSEMNDLLGLDELRDVLAANAGPDRPAILPAPARRVRAAVLITCAIVAVAGAVSGALFIGGASLRGSNGQRAATPSPQTVGRECGSGGPGASQAVVNVPDVRAQSLAAAFERLRRAGLRVAVSGRFWLGSNQMPTVAVQSPAPGKRAEPGSVVTLYGRGGPIGVPVGPEKAVHMPALEGMTLAAAVRKLNRAGLAWETEIAVRLPASSACDLLSAFRVRRQRPPAGTLFEQTELLSKPKDGTRYRTTPVRLTITEIQR